VAAIVGAALGLLLRRSHATQVSTEDGVAENSAFITA
jgi:hypothetical protein